MLIFVMIVAYFTTRHTPVPVTPPPVVVPTPQRIGPADIYPTVPGSINTAITQATIGQTICNKNWSTSSERPPTTYTTPLKEKQIARLDLADTSTKDYEEDHLISLELGGSPTDPDNLWPEPYTASIPDGGARTKDQVENFLHAQVCAGTITLAQAQQEIVTDWYKVYVDNLQGKNGSVETYIDQDDN